MKTIRPPKKDEEKFYHLTCTNFDCNALLEVEQNELELTPKGWFENLVLKNPEDGLFYNFECPHCEKRTYIALMKLHEYQYFPK